MSIVTYFPKGELEFILTISMEEASPHHSLLPIILNQGSKQILCPSDSQEEGTFAAASAEGTAVCVFKSNNSVTAKSSYRQSIRKTPLDYFKYGNIFSFYLNYDFQKIEPFIMIIFQDKKLYEIKWDGETHVVKNLLQKQKYFWSSLRSLQHNGLITKGIDLFESWSENASDFGVSEIRRFHQALIKRETNASLLEKEEKKGMAITTIFVSSNQINMLCENTLANEETKNSLQLLLKQEVKY